ncbi:MAG: hypothetical protein IPM64_14400 [Phycisphaerales bacterium]|nr:hypothetical protein [Phycisphaerales bacterium]
MLIRWNRAALIAVAALGTVAAMAQEQPPGVTIDSATISRNLTGNPGGPFAAPVPFNFATDLAAELDIIAVTLNVIDPDWIDPEADQPVLLRFSALAAPYIPSPAPSIPAVTGTSRQFGFAANNPGAAIPVPVVVTLQVPEFAGRNQARLRGEIVFDVRYTLIFEVINPDQNLEEIPPRQATATLNVVENPAANPKNPPPFADAGSDRRVVAGTTFELDGSRTTDSTNTGFDPRDPNVFEKDTLTYVWEWISGPERVDPVVRSPVQRPEFGEITLNSVGEYVFRLSVSDGVNPLPSTDTVKVTVVSAIPPNRAPSARIIGPSGAVVVGSAITLDGTSSTDPDGDALTFRWVQTDELGGKLPASEVERAFQPLSGVSQPVVNWQAIKAGTFHFRLIVNDGEASSTAAISVTVSTSTVSGTVAQNPSASADSADAFAAPLAAPGACGAGLAFGALAPLVLALGRRRR